MFEIFGAARKRSRKLKYSVKVRGVIVSKHYTKKAADRSAKGKRGARVSKLLNTKNYRRALRTAKYVGRKLNPVYHRYSRFKGRFSRRKRYTRKRYY